jgi:hypothetical protein
VINGSGFQCVLQWFLLLWNNIFLGGQKWRIITVKNAAINIAAFLPWQTVLVH